MIAFEDKKIFEKNKKKIYINKKSIPEYLENC
jgi:hypothetical protein